MFSFKPKKENSIEFTLMWFGSVVLSVLSSFRWEATANLYWFHYDWLNWTHLLCLFLFLNELIIIFFLMNEPCSARLVIITQNKNRFSLNSGVSNLICLVSFIVSIFRSNFVFFFRWKNIAKFTYSFECLTHI